MLKKNKWKVILSCVIILLPALFGAVMWNKLPDVMATHWGVASNADGSREKSFAVFGLPAFQLVVHLVCLLVTMLDKKQKDQNPKALGMIFWIIPIISILTSGIMYCSAFGKEVGITLLVPIMLSVMFILLGNYLPKVKQNNTLGIKVSWTLTNKENWNKTHRFAGKVWVVGGLLLLCAAFLPSSATILVVLSVTVVTVCLPIGYSYCIYRQHRKQGVPYNVPTKSKAERIAGRIAAILIFAIIIGVLALMFTGNIQINCEETAFEIRATYWTDLEIKYSELETIEYRTDFEIGARTNGFGSAKLAMGSFENDEFGAYTLYAYTDAKEFIVLTSGDKILVIGMGDAEETQRIYSIIHGKIEQVNYLTSSLFNFYLLPPKNPECDFSEE